MVDYSKFDKIDVEEEPAPAPAVAKPKKADAKKPQHCANCRNEGAKLRCSTCKKVVYCNRNCQRSDWRFHKRICKKPEPKKKDPPPKKPKNSSGGGGGSGSGSGSSSSSSDKPTRAKGGTDAVDVDEEDAAILKDLQGYRYFHKELTEEEKRLRDAEWVPEKVAATPASDDSSTGATAGGAGGGAGVDGADGATSDVSSATSTPSKVSAQSAWNKGTTWEDRDMTPWSKDRLRALLVGQQCAIAGGTVKVTDLTNWDGDAQIVVTRGKTRYIYDFNFKLELEAVGDGSNKKATVHFLEIANGDDPYEIKLAWGSPKPSGLQQAALRSIFERPSGVYYTQLVAQITQYIAEFRAK